MAKSKNIKRYRPICIEDRITTPFSKGCNGLLIDSKDLNPKKHLGPIVIRGLTKRKLMRFARENGRDFYYIDTGYFGNKKRKVWHRVVKNDVQHGKVVERDCDRFEKLDIKLKGWKKTGSKILLCPPSEKSMLFYGEGLDAWMKSAIKRIKKNTDREIEIRYKPKIRHERVYENAIEHALMNDVFCLVTYNSIAATEAIINGIPAFTLAPNAASPMCLQDISKIEQPIYPDRHEWACHLAYGQFSCQEMIDGTAWNILNGNDKK